MSSKIEIINTPDGSQTLFLPHLNETYHSVRGAFSESNHVFIENGLKHFIESSKVDLVTIFEMGFGTGLNALLSAEFCKINEIQCEYITIEKFPLEQNIFRQLKSPQGFSNDIFEALHLAKWEEFIGINPYFRLKKVEGDIANFALDNNSVDIIYWDAFAPSKQEEVWNLEIIEKYFKWMKAGGTLVTYCAQGQFKRNLRSSGFQVESLEGPLGKKEMTRAKVIVKVE